MGRKSREKKIVRPKLSKRQKEAQEVYEYCQKYAAKHGFVLVGASQCKCNVVGAIYIRERPQEQQD